MVQGGLKCRAWLALGMIVILTAALRLNMLQVPLERDEGEFAYMGQLLLQGIPPYLEAYNMKLPGMYLIYAMIMGGFGQSIAAIHMGLMLFNLAAVMLIFFLTRYLFDELAGVIAALVYALLSVSPSVLGTSAHATQFIVPVAVGGLILLLKGIDRERRWMLVLSGLLLGSAFLIKQHAIFFILFGVLFGFGRMVQGRPAALKEAVFNTTLLALSSALPFLACCAALYLTGVFPNFWFWTFNYSQQYASEMPWSLPVFIHRTAQAIRPWELIWTIAGIGLTSIFWNDRAREARWFWLCFVLFSFLTVCPGFYFRPHYFVTLLPAVAMLSAVAVSASMSYLSLRFSPRLKVVPIFFLIIALAIPMVAHIGFFRTTPANASRMMYGPNPFPESLQIAAFIREHSSAEDKIAVIGSEPQIYFYSGRKAATGYIYVYALMEPQKYASSMQDGMIREIEAAKSKFIVFINAPKSWLIRPGSDLRIVHWVKEYVRKSYHLRGYMDVGSDFMTLLQAPPDIEKMWDRYISVWERNEIPPPEAKIQHGLKN